jgi:endonuclease/exonuclease/phosphatase family metal-dependent hydrolase
VFNNTWDLVALHHAGVSHSDGSALNDGILMSAIVANLVARRSRERSDSEMIDKVLGSLVGSNPQLGFFDTAGLVADPSVEVVVNNFTGSSEFCDVGFWNIEHFNDRVTDARVDAVADVVANLSLDVLGLTEVQDGALDRLVSALGGQGMTADFRLMNAPGSQDIAVLFDARTTRVTVRDDLVQRHSRRLSMRTPTGRTVFPRHPFFVECTVDDEIGRHAKFLMIVVHLKAFGDASSRARRRLAAQMLAEIIDDIREQEGIQIVLGGDFNEKLDSDVLDAIKSSPDLFSLTLDDATSGDRSAISFVGDNHQSLIDHIVVSRDVQLGDVMGDDAAIVRLDRDMPSFPDVVSDHVPVAFRMIFRNAPIVVTGDDDDNQRRLDIPAGSSAVRVTFERSGEILRLAENGKPKKKRKRAKT